MIRVGGGDPKPSADGDPPDTGILDPRIGHWGSLTGQTGDPGDSWPAEKGAIGLFPGARQWP